MGLLKNFEILGWGLHLQTCFKCGKSLTEDFHFFDVEQGGGVCEGCRVSSRKVFSLSLSLLEWMNNPSQEKGISPEEEALLQELLEPILEDIEKYFCILLNFFIKI